MFFKTDLNKKIINLNRIFSFPKYSSEIYKKLLISFKKILKELESLGSPVMCTRLKHAAVALIGHLLVSLGQAAHSPAYRAHSPANKAHSPAANRDL